MRSSSLEVITTFFEDPHAPREAENMEAGKKLEANQSDSIAAG